MILERTAEHLICNRESCYLCQNMFRVFAHALCLCLLWQYKILLEGTFLVTFIAQREMVRHGLSKQSEYLREHIIVCVSWYCSGVVYVWTVTVYFPTKAVVLSLTLCGSTVQKRKKNAHNRMISWKLQIFTETKRINRLLVKRSLKLSKL